MKVELSIADDRELRNAIRDMIKGEVTSIARGEIRTILAEVIKEGVLPKTTEDLNKIISEEIRKVIHDTLFEKNNWSSPEYIKVIAREELTKEIQKWLKQGNVV